MCSYCLSRLLPSFTPRGIVGHLQKCDRSVRVQLVDHTRDIARCARPVRLRRSSIGRREDQMAQATYAAVPQALTLTERDRRYARLRAELAERGVGATLVSGSNLFYLTNGLS